MVRVINPPKFCRAKFWRVKNNLNYFLVVLLIFSLMTAWLFSGWPRIWQNPAIPPKIQEAQAATVTKTYSFPSNSESWTNTACGAAPGASCAWQSGDGSPANGSLEEDETRKNKSGTWTWQLSGITWESLGVPAGSTVTTVDGSYTHIMATCTTCGTTNTSGDLLIRNSGDTATIATLETVVTYSGATSWATRDASGAQSIGASYQASGTGIILRITGTIATPNTAGARSTLRQDEISLTITYSSTTTLGDGTDPSNSTVAPGSTNNYLDQFNFKTNSGTDTVSALTVTSANTTAISSMQIWNEAMTTQYFGTVSTPDVNAWNFSGGSSISVTTATSDYRVIFNAKSHADLAAGTYAVTGNVTSFTSTNAQSGTDTDSATITVDNSPPSDASWETITPGNQQIELIWTNPGADFYRELILRRAGATVDASPTDGTEYSVGGTIGSSTVAYVGSGTATTDTGLTNGTNYWYKIFAYDSYINYASGVNTGPHIPVLNLSVSVSSGIVSYGIISLGGSRNTTPSDLNNTQIATNDGGGTAKFNIRGSNSTPDAWVLAATAGNNQYVHEFSTDGGTIWTALTTSYQTWAFNVAVDATRGFDLRITVPSSTSVASQQNVDVTVQAASP